MVFVMTLLSLVDGVWKHRISLKLIICTPDNKMPLMKWHKIEIIFHEPISMKGKTLKDVDMVKKQVFELIDRTLKEKNCIQYEDNKRNAS